MQTEGIQWVSLEMRKDSLCQGLTQVSGSQERRGTVMSTRQDEQRPQVPLPAFRRPSAPTSHALPRPGPRAPQSAGRGDAHRAVEGNCKES